MRKTWGLRIFLRATFGVCSVSSSLCIRHHLGALVMGLRCGLDDHYTQSNKNVTAQRSPGSRRAKVHSVWNITFCPESYCALCANSVTSVTCCGGEIQLKLPVSRGTLASEAGMTASRDRRLE